MPNNFTDINLQGSQEVTTPQSEVSAGFTLTCFEMWSDGIKATKLRMDPISDCFGAVFGTVCCIATATANAEADKKTPATRYDVVHANQIRRNEAAEASFAFAAGYCMGDALVDTLSVTAGVFVGGARAAFFSCTGNNASTNTVFGQPRETLQDVELFDSCLRPACCR